MNDHALTLDALQERIETFLGMTLHRDNFQDDSCDLLAISPTGVNLFKIFVYSARSGWRVAGRSDFHGDTWNNLVHIHE